MKRVSMLWLLLAAAAVAHADQPSADAKVEEHFCAKATTQYEMNQCASVAAEAADHELNATYHAVLKKWAAYPHMLTKLRLAQQRWLAYRDADLAARFAIEDDEGPYHGTAYPAAYALYQAGLERERTARLCDFLRGTADGEQDSSPCAELVRHPLVVPHIP